MGELIEYEQFNLNEPIIGDDEIKILKSKCTMLPVTEDDTEIINNSFFINKYNRQDIINNNHFFIW